MNLTDRVALHLGRAIIRAEEMAVRAEQAEARAAALQDAAAARQVDRVDDTTAAPEGPSTLAGRKEESDAAAGR